MTYCTEVKVHVAQAGTGRAARYAVRAAAPFFFFFFRARCRPRPCGGVPSDGTPFSFSFLFSFFLFLRPAFDFAATAPFPQFFFLQSETESSRTSASFNLSAPCVDSLSTSFYSLDSVESQCGRSLCFLQAGRTAARSFPRAAWFKLRGREGARGRGGRPRAAAAPAGGDARGVEREKGGEGRRTGGPGLRVEGGRGARAGGSHGAARAGLPRRRPGGG